jgi:hypothetical protein
VKELSGNFAIFANSLILKAIPLAELDGLQHR